MNFSLKSVPIAVGILTGVILAGSMVLETVNGREKASLLVNNQTVSVYVARSEDEKARGLSGRPGLKKNEGMLFIFDKSERHGFWMKDMKFPIDIIWIRDRKIVGVEKNIPPPALNSSVSGDQLLKIYYPPEPVDMVLEMSSGGAEFIGAWAGNNIIDLFSSLKSGMGENY